MRRLARTASLVAALVAAGCATHQMSLPSSTAAPLAGRMAVKVEAHGDQPARAVSASFELRGDAQAGELDLSTPLGSLLGRARWNPVDVVLETSRGEQRYADLGTLTRDVLGESVPVAALFDWLRGQPWPGADSRATQPPAHPGFEQLGWTVNLARFAEGHITAHRSQPPAVTVRTQLDRP